MEFRALRPHELPSWFDVVARGFGQSRDYFVRHWESDPHALLEGIRVAVEGERIVSTLRVFPRTIFLGGLPVPVGGIGEVCTDEAYRGRGLSGRLLEDAIRFMAGREMVLSVLFAGRHSLYSRFGWKPVPMRMATARLRPEPGPYECAPANPRHPAEARQLQLIHQRFAPQFQGATVRSDLAYWTGWVAGEWKRALIARRDGQVRGYLAANWTGPEELYLEDFAALPGEAEPLLRCAVAALAQERSLREVRLRYPAALAIGLNPEAHDLNQGPMYRVLLPQLLPMAAAQALEQMIRGEIEQHLIWQTDWF
ncbi:MAG: GNAT family N-acetyltransferase [Bacillota bacterium]